MEAKLEFSMDLGYGRSFLHLSYGANDDYYGANDDYISFYMILLSEYRKQHSV